MLIPITAHSNFRRLYYLNLLCLFVVYTYCVPYCVAYRNAKLLSQCGGVQVILQHIIQCHDSPRINEALIQTLFYLLNNPQTRQDCTLTCGLDVGAILSSQLIIIVYFLGNRHQIFWEIEFIFSCRPYTAIL